MSVDAVDGPDSPNISKKEHWQRALAAGHVEGTLAPSPFKQDMVCWMTIVYKEVNSTYIMFISGSISGANFCNMLHVKSAALFSLHDYFKASPTNDQPLSVPPPAPIIPNPPPQSINQK